MNIPHDYGMNIPPTQIIESKNGNMVSYATIYECWKCRNFLVHGVDSYKIVGTYMRKEDNGIPKNIVQCNNCLGNVLVKEARKKKEEEMRDIVVGNRAEARRLSIEIEAEKREEKRIGMEAVADLMEAVQQDADMRQQPIKPMIQDGTSNVQTHNGFKLVQDGGHKTITAGELSAQAAIRDDDPSSAFQPKNEAGVVFLFGALAQRLGYRPVHVQIPFPDAIFADKKGRYIRVEFEYVASNFVDHKHDPEGADLIICWDMGDEEKIDEYLPPIIELKEYGTPF